MHQINIFTASIYLMGKWGFSRYKFDGLYFGKIQSKRSKNIVWLCVSGKE